MGNKAGYMTTPLQRVSWWSFFIGQNAYYNITFLYLSTYLMMQGIDPLKISAVLLVVKIWDAINDPLFGYIFDKVKFKNGLKSLPWVRISTALTPVVTVLMFAMPTGISELGKLLWLAISYILWDTIYTLTDVPSYSMLTTMTDNIEERTTMLAVNRVFSGAGYLLCTVLLGVLIGENVGMSYTWGVAIVSFISLLTMIPVCVFGKEKNYRVEEDQGDFSIRQMLSYLGKNKYLLIFYAGYCCTDGLKTSAAVTLFVSFYLFGNSTFAILLNLLNMVPGVVAALMMPWLLKKFDKFKVLMVCNIIGILSGLAIYFTGYQDQTLFLVLTVLRCIPMSVCGILYFMFTPDCAEYGEYKSGISAKGITFAIQTFSVKITAAVSTALALALLGLFSWISVEAENFEQLAQLGIQQSPQALEGLWFVYALVPVFGLIFSSLCWLFYKLNDKDVQIMAKCNAGEITREEAEAKLSRKY